MSVDGLAGRTVQWLAPIEQRARRMLERTEGVDLYYCSAQLGATVYLCESCQLFLSLRLGAAQSPPLLQLLFHFYPSLSPSSLLFCYSIVQLIDKQPTSSSESVSAQRAPIKTKMEM